MNPPNSALHTDAAGAALTTPVEISLVEGKLVIAPLPVQSYSLDELLAQITPENMHREQDTGNPEGNEVW